MKVLSRLAALGALLALVFLAGPAEAQLTRGSLSGTVRDATGAVVPGAAVTVTNQETNIGRSAVTNDVGFYRIPALEPGHYAVRTELGGFAPVESKDVPIKTALEATLNVELKVAGLGEELTITGQTESVELNKSNPTIGLTSTARQVVELPTTAARNINQLALLTPNTYAAPGSSGIASNGQRARNNNFMVDGSDNNDISVTVVANNQIVPEWVAEFQVQTNPYNVEFGRNSGAQINVITRSGANKFHFDVWEYYRNSELNALSNIDKANGFTSPPELTRNQFGGDISGPIFKDKTFFFVSYQRDNLRPGPAPSTTTVRIPTEAGYAALQSVPLRAGQSAASRQAVLQQIAFLQDIYSQGVVFRNLRNDLVNGVAIQTGQTNVNNTQPGTFNNFLARIDHKLGRNDNLTLRYYYNQQAQPNLTSNLGFGELFAATQNVTGQSLAASETHIFNQTLLNEFRFSWIRRDLQFPENDPTSPTAGITGLFTIGGLSNFPQGRLQNSFQFQDIVTKTAGRHTFKFGADVRYIQLDNSAAFDSKGTFTFNNLQNYMNNVANPFAQALQTASFNAKQWQTFLFAQDDFRITPDLTVNLGLRYEISTVPLGFFGATDPESLNALVPAPTQRDTNNWAPRVGVNWSPRSANKILGNGKTVFSGGYGISYDVLFYNILTVNASNYPRVVVPRIDPATDVYPNVAQVSGTAVFDPLATYVNTPVDAQNPMTQFWSFSYQREFMKDYVLQVGYTGSHSTNGVNQLQANPAVLTAAQAALVAETKNANAIPITQARRVSPQFGSRVLIATTAKATYNGGFISLQKRLSHGIQFGGSYSFSSWYSDNDESLGVAAITNSSPQIPQDYNNIAAEWSRSVFDRPHRFVVNYIWEIPGPKSGGWRQVLGGWQLAGVTQYQSGQPFTVFAGVDSNGNGTAGGDRPNLGSGTLVWDDDRKTFTNQGAYVIPLGTNNLPLLNGNGNGNAPRNGERGAGYWNTDLSLLKRFYIGTHQLIIRADGLNIFNQDEYGNPIANMTNTGFGTNTNDWGNRSFTLSAKFSF